MGLFNNIQHNCISNEINANFNDIVLNKYAQFKGRANRTEFWLYVLVYFVLGTVSFLLLNVFIGLNTFRMIFMTFYIILMLVLLIPGLALSVRRMHDIGKSGSWVFINLIPIVGSVWFLVLAVTKSEPGINRYEN